MSRPLTLALLVALPGVAGAAPAKAPETAPAKPPAAAPAPAAAKAPAAAPAKAPAARLGPRRQADPAREGLLGIGGVGIVKLEDKSVCSSLRQRNERITVRLINALEKMHRRNRFGDPIITIEPPDDEPWIVIEGVQVMKVTFEDAKANGRDAQTLAREYVEEFRKALRRVYTP